MENININPETPVQSFTTPIPPVQKQNNIYKYLFVISLLILISVITILSLSVKKNNSETITDISVISPTLFEKQISDYIPIFTTKGHKKIDIETKKITSNLDEDINFYKFEGLPEEYKDLISSLENRIFLRSKDRSKIIIRSMVYDQTKKPNEHDGSLPIISEIDYLCTITDNKCIKTEIISSIKINGPLCWTDWDSQNDLVYGHICGHGVGSAGPVYIYSIKDKTYKETIGYNTPPQNESEIMASVPISFMSPSFSKFIMFTNDDDVKLLLFNSNDLSKPEKTIKLNISGKNHEISTAIAWFKDEKRVVLMNKKQIYVLNLETEKKSLIYTDFTQNESFLWLDFSNIAISPSERFVVFIDYVKDDISLQSKKILKAIDLNTNKEVYLSDDQTIVSLRY